MPEDKFILVRKPRDYRYTGYGPLLRLPLDTYKKLAEWAAETEIPVSELMKMAVEYADKHLAYVSE